MNENNTFSRYPSSVSTRKGKYRLSGMELDFISLVPAGDDPLASVVISKAAPDESGDSSSPSSKISTKTPTEENNVGTINKSDLAPEVVAYIDGLEAEIDTLGEQVEKQESEIEAKDETIEELQATLSKSAPADDEAAQEISKALLAKADPAVRALIEKQQADLAAVQEIAKAEREQRLEREYIAKAEALPMLTEEKSKMASLLRRAAEALSPEDNETLNTVLKAANAQIATSNVFASFGSGGAETTVSKSLKAAAAEIKKNNPTLTDEQAEVAAMEQNPDLANAVLRGEDA